MAYFTELQKSRKPSTLWAIYSMFKLKVCVNIDISLYHSLTGFLKQKSKGYAPKKAKHFTETELKRFLDNAPDVAWLDVKVTTLFNIFPFSFFHSFVHCSGCCRTHELPSIRLTNIVRYDDMYYVTVPRCNTKTNEDNCCAITGPLLDIVRRYESLRPNHASSDRFFLNFQMGKCTNQTIGKNKIYKIPNRIAVFLNLPSPHR